MTELDARQLACLASPTRNAVFTTLRSMGEGSARELSESMGRSPEALHYHLKALSSAGLVRVKYRRRTRRKPEAVYESAARDYRLPDLGVHPELASLTHKAVTAGMRQAARGYQSAAAKATTNASLRPHFHILRATIRLTEEDAARFLQMVEAASEFAKSRDSAEGLRLHWSSLIYPETG